MKTLLKINNGIILIIIGIMHSQFAFSADGFKTQFIAFAKTNFFQINQGLDELMIKSTTTYETMAAFWFFYFGVLVIAIGIFVFSIERNKKTLPSGFTLSYLIVILIGVYMIPNSGMTIFMLPHAVFMLIINFVKKKQSKNQLDNVETTY